VKKEVLTTFDIKEKVEKFTCVVKEEVEEL
jgi:hypothetical protein